MIYLMIATFVAKAGDGDLMDQASFTRYFVSALERAVPDAFIDHSSNLQVYVFSADGEESTLFLDDLYEAYTDSPHSVKHLVGKRVTNYKAQQIILQSQTDDIVLPIIKSKRFIEATKRQLNVVALEELPFYAERYNEELYVTFANKNSPHKLLSREELTKSRKNLYQLLDESITNLEHHFNRYGANIQRVETEDKGRVYVLAVDEFFEASALLSPSVWTKKNFPIKGDFVAFVPNQSTIIVAGSRDKEGLKKAKILAFDAYQALDKPISIYGYKNANGKWHRQTR